MADEKEDRTARAIRERRERAGVTRRVDDVSGTTAAAASHAKPEEPGQPARSRLSEEKRAEIRREIEALNDRPVMRARRIAQYVVEGVEQREIADALGVGRPWVSKRIALTQAPPEVLQQIEFGRLTEHRYYNDRAGVEAELTGDVRDPKFQRALTMPITLDAARAVAEILAHLAASLGAIPIRLDSKATKKQLGEIINLRAAELRSLFIKK